MTPETRSRRPQAFDADSAGFVVTDEAAEQARPEAGPSESTHAREAPAAAGVQVSPAPAPDRSARWGRVLLGALVSLALLGMGIWFSNTVSQMLARDDWLGWLALVLLAVSALAAAALILREVFGIMRISRLTRLRRDAETAQRKRDPVLERKVVRQLRGHLGASREGQWDLKRFREEERHMREPGQLLGLADRVLLQRPDAEARRVVYQSARRVGVVTALVPIGVIVVGFVLFENLRMVRRLATAYGGRPGFFGGLRLFTWIIGHMAATGAIALTDDLWGQFLGQDMLRRVSRKLGEGAFNGAMTARLGVAAISVCRPLPFIDSKPPRARHIFYEAFPELRPAFGRKAGKSGEDGEAAVS